MIVGFFSPNSQSMINEARRDDSKRVEFVRVVSAKWLLVAGIIDFITLEAASIDDDDRITKFYEAKFLERRNCLELMSWHELESPPITTQSSGKELKIQLELAKIELELAKQYETAAAIQKLKK
ncbi:uncharacterized protein LOC132271048 [Cornus florida]|uniref:uncharacterized protein LOC132271048 n=1 Tax=Cornus florida TaxID=4283 RepID=UPI0028A17701|nr:uncharacterized protein LOC132271048 [Cornus florida]